MRLIQNYREFFFSLNAYTCDVIHTDFFLQDSGSKVQSEGCTSCPWPAKILPCPSHFSNSLVISGNISPSTNPSSILSKETYILLASKENIHECHILSSTFTSVGDNKNLRFQLLNYFFGFGDSKKKRDYYLPMVKDYLFYTKVVVNKMI
jgi:hypothetical protein